MLFNLRNLCLNPKLSKAYGTIAPCLAILANCMGSTNNDVNVCKERMLVKES